MSVEILSIRKNTSIVKFSWEILSSQTGYTDLPKTDFPLYKTTVHFLHHPHHKENIKTSKTNISMERFILIATCNIHNLKNLAHKSGKVVMAIE